MKVFVSGQIKEKEYIRSVYTKLESFGFGITHDWTITDDLPSHLKNSKEAGVRAEKDIQGVLDADVYILVANNVHPGKGMYVELGAALARAMQGSLRHVCIVGPINHESIFYHHPLTKHFASIDLCIEYLKTLHKEK